ncbi:helix-turn-helix transcriptional regulator [Streptomyces sp. WAC01280]|uniref:ArsR/SmtB family transcription factor n=1 Tax=Streptomyces sp. WAC01280 TaxID=2487424 RepID=UPI000F769081|nr:winged helix-turn-helix domain-containing protein [Streptomyces sp. WAC01280]RSS57310.1 ArsR family transcriptional regulator [Streptomyces sp. WAC01280]
MIRLHFTADDLRRITLAPAVNALSETALSLRFSLRQGPGPGSGSHRHGRWDRPRPAARQWHQSLRGTASARAGVLAELVTDDGYLPDFLLQPSLDDFSDALEAAASTPAEQLTLDLGIPHATGRNGHLSRPGPWARDLAEGSPNATRALVADARRYFHTSVEPLWPRIRGDALTDRALRAEMLLRGGVDALLTTLATTWRWEAPILHLPSASAYDIPLCGRGLLLVPSWFATGPLVMYRPRAATVLVYPLYDGGTAASAPDGVDGRPEALAALLGRTRAHILALLRMPATTTALAERAALSLPAASRHTRVLREAGLVDTTRTGVAVLHTLTPLGHTLLAGT